MVWCRFSAGGTATVGVMIFVTSTMIFNLAHAVAVIIAAVILVFVLGIDMTLSQGSKSCVFSCPHCCCCES